MFMVLQCCFVALLFSKTGNNDLDISRFCHAKDCAQMGSSSVFYSGGPIFKSLPGKSALLTSFS
jgi:hypothetical protein